MTQAGCPPRIAPGLLLINPALSARQLVVLDDMKRLLDLARDARIVLSGDTGQHTSVVHGDALRILCVCHFATPAAMETPTANSP